MINKKDVKNKIALAVFAGSFLSTTLTGCYSSVLYGTVLQGAVVVTFEDGTKDIAVRYDVTDDSYVVYQSVISDTYYTDDDCSNITCRYKILGNYPIENEESIASYLTEEDMEHLRNPKEKSDAVTSIMSRIVSTNNARRTREQ